MIGDMDLHLGKNHCWFGHEGAVRMGCSRELLAFPGLVARAVKQVHGNRILDDPAWMDGVLEADGLVSDLPGVILIIRTADCVPVHMTDGSRIALVHAGWRGVRAGIVKGLVAYFDPEKTMAVLGPAISGPRYEVDIDLYGEWLEEDPGLGPWLREIDATSTKRLLDLKGFLSSQLQDMGVKRVTTIPLCTFDSTLPSYRRQGRQAGRIVNYIYRIP